MNSSQNLADDDYIIISKSPTRFTIQKDINLVHPDDVISVSRLIDHIVIREGQMDSVRLNLAQVSKLIDVLRILKCYD